MIVKDEIEVIERCLRSVKQLLDYWVIVDTGSTDGTQSLIRSVLGDVPGELYERPWINFAHNRNEALDLARGKSQYILFIDADEILVISKEFEKSKLNKDFYIFKLIERSQTDMYRISFIKDRPCWFWKGVLHEAIDASEEQSGELLETIIKHSFTHDGKRTQNPLKFFKDAEILEKALETDGTNSRYVFYLAQSYGNAKQYDLALHWYERRTFMGGDPDEIFWSFYCLGMIHQHLGSKPSLFIDHYSQAYQKNPTRAEPLFQLAEYFYQSNQPLIGYFLAKACLDLAAPKFGFYFHAWVYEYAALFIFARCAQAIHRKEEALHAYHQILRKNIPLDMRSLIEELQNGLL